MKYGDDDIVYDESEGDRLTIKELHDFLHKILLDGPELENGTVWADTPSLYMPIDRIRLKIDKIKFPNAKPEVFLQLENSEFEE